MADEDLASLSDAIAALRDDLAKAWSDGQNSHVRFKVEPVELTVQVGVTKSGEVSAFTGNPVSTLGPETANAKVNGSLRRLPSIAVKPLAIVTV